MRRILLILALVAIPVFCAEEAEHKEVHEPSIYWKWANFALLAGALYYIGKGPISAFFAERNKAIKSELQEARKMREDSEARIAKIEKSVAHLGADIEDLRKSGKAEMAAEGERIQSETARMIQKIQASAELEIASTVKLATQELKAYSADLAIQLATQQIRERMSASTHDQLVDTFVGQLNSQKATH